MPLESWFGVYGTTRIEVVLRYGATAHSTGQLKVACATSFRRGLQCCLGLAAIQQAVDDVDQFAGAKRLIQERIVRVLRRQRSTSVTGDKEDAEAWLQCSHAVS